MNSKLNPFDRLRTRTQKSKLQFKIQKLIGNWKLEIGNSREGFSLIELLVVISIIAVLSALIFGSLYVIPRMRDAQRKSDLLLIQHALEQYKADGDLYPTNDSWPGCGSPLEYASTSTVYLPKFPCDPNGTGYWNSGAYYTWSSDPVADPPTRYKIGACLENASDTGLNVTNTNPVSADTSCTSSKWYVLESP